jgi:hypothetical protein
MIIIYMGRVFGVTVKNYLLNRILSYLQLKHPYVQYEKYVLTQAHLINSVHKQFQKDSIE